MAKKGTTLTEKERRFVEAFLGKCAGNATQAVLAAGYQQNRNAAAVTGSQLLRKPNVQVELSRRLTKREEKTDITNAEIDAVFIKMGLDEKRDDVVRQSALKELNKCRGRHSIKVSVEGRVTIEDAMAQVSDRLRARQVKQASR